MPLFIIKDISATKDHNIYYDGKVFPRDAKKPIKLTGDTEGIQEQVNYNGGQFPRDRKAYQPPLTDLTNFPSLIIVGNVQLPIDTVIYISGSKTLAQSKILDGVSVTERISRQPYELEFECVVRDQNDAGEYIFPQDALDNLWNNIWIPDTVQTIQNTYLNKLGIQEMVIDTITPATVRGSKNIPLRIHGYENIPGQTIIVNPTTITGFTIGGAI